MSVPYRTKTHFRDGRACYTVQSDGCWIWTGSTNGRGYPHMSFQGRTVYAHRHYYTVLVGPIPAGLHLDHLCRRRACVNPEHLEPVTQAENIRRGANTKLHADQVRSIRRAAGCGVHQCVLAAICKVDSSTI